MKSRLQRSRRGAWAGAMAAGFWVAADLLSSFLAIGFLAEASWGTVALIALATLNALVIGAIVGALLAAISPAAVTRRLSPRLRQSLVALVAVAILVGGYLSRSGRRHTPPAPTAASAPAGAPSILLVVIDALRADTLYGAQVDFPRAPVLRELAAKSIVFAEAESTAGWTIPATATLLTGIHAETLDASAGAIPDWAPTTVELLHRHGYATGAVVDNIILEPRNGFARGFETFHQKSGFRFAFSLATFRMLPQFVRQDARVWSRAFYQGYAGTTAAAVERIQSTGDDRPVFLYVHYMDPHAPYLHHDAIGADPPDTEPIDYYAARDRLVNHTGPPPTPPQLAWLEHRYRGEVEVLDRSLGDVLAAWRERYGDDGIIAVTADHGEEFLDHGRLGHGVTLHREMTHVPLLLQLPRGMRAGVRLHNPIPTPVAHMDLMATVLDIAAIGPGPSKQPGVAMQGQSWWPWLRGEPGAAPRAQLLASHSRNGRRIYRLRVGDAVYSKEMFYDGQPTQYALYDLATDPTEQHNRVHNASEKPTVPIAAALERVANEFANARGDAAPNAAAVDVESLRAMGYVQ